MDYYRHMFLALLILLLLSSMACSPNTSPASSRPSPVSTLPASPTPTLSAETLLYQADWSHGLAGWQASEGWKVMNGVLQSTVGSKLSITIPYEPTVPNYAIEFRLQIVNVPENGGFLTLSADPATGKDGYVATIFNLLKPGPRTSGLAPQLTTLIDPENHMDTEDAQVRDYDPGSAWKTYRVEVSGPHVVFIIDDARLSQAVSTRTDTLSQGPIHFLCGGVVLRISNVRIVAL
jgi:hypothetical protein